MSRWFRVALMFLVATTAPWARAEEWSKSFTVSGKPDVHVVTDDGNVRLSTGSAKTIEARVVTVGWRIAPDEVRVLESQTGDHVELEVRLPRRRGNFGHRSVEVELAVPPESNAEIRTGDGNISAASLKGEMRLSTGDGDVDARGLEGALEVSTGDGNVRVGGNFYRLSLKTGDGQVEVEVNPGSKMATSWTVRTGDGNVTLRLPEGFAADLDARTGDGTIELGFPVTVSGVFRSSEIHGKINGGGMTLSVHTGDGSIRLEHR